MHYYTIYKYFLETAMEIILTINYLKNGFGLILVSTISQEEVCVILFQVI